MAISKEFRTLMASKMSTPKVGRGKPSNSEGGEGDLQVRQLSSGRVTIYAKFNNAWHDTGGSGGSPSDIIGQGLDDNGYVKFGNGFIIMWGTTEGNSDTETVAFANLTPALPNFPNNCFGVVACDGQATPGNDNVAAYSPTTTGFGCRHGANERPARFIAMGN